MIWLLAGVGLLTIGYSKIPRASAIFAAVFLLFSFLAVCPGLYFREHYFVLMLPAMALLAGSTVSSTRKPRGCCLRWS